MHRRVPNEDTAALFDGSREQEKDFGVWRKLERIRFCARDYLSSGHSVKLRVSDYLFNLQRVFNLNFVLFRRLFIYVLNFVRIAVQHP